MKLFNSREINKNGFFYKLGSVLAGILCVLVCALIAACLVRLIVLVWP